MYQCDPVAAEDWLSEPQLAKKISADGWSVNRMKQDGGCWEVTAPRPTASGSRPISTPRPARCC